MKQLRLLSMLCALTLLSGCGNYKTEKREIGYLGEARLNPFLAASRLLESRGYDTERKRSRNALPEPTIALVVPAGSIENLADAKRYKRWIENGGHVIYLTSGYGSLAWKKSANFWKIQQQMELEHPLLEQFNIDIKSVAVAAAEEELEKNDDEDENPFAYLEKEYKQGQVEIYSRPLDVQMSSAQRLDATGSEWHPDVVLGKSNNAQMLSMPIYHGRLSILTSAYPLRNRYIGELDHGVMFIELIQTHGIHSVHFIRGSGTTFFGMLLEHGWMPLLGLVLLCGFWVWKNLPRFGPLIPHIDVEARQFTEHIEMTGRFLWKNKASSALLSSVSSHIRRNLYRRHPHFADDVDATVNYFVENTELSQEEVSEALSSLPIEDPANMTRVVKNLKTLTESL